jgi:hypothetical protein
MVAALYLIRAISGTGGKEEVRLFEGFVSFKAKGSKSNHSRDVELLREVVEALHTLVQLSDRKRCG